MNVSFWIALERVTLDEWSLLRIVTYTLKTSRTRRSFLGLEADGPVKNYETWRRHQLMKGKRLLFRSPWKRSIRFLRDSKERTSEIRPRGIVFHHRNSLNQSGYGTTFLSVFDPWAKWSIYLHRSEGRHGSLHGPEWAADDHRAEDQSSRGGQRT